MDHSTLMKKIRALLVLLARLRRSHCRSAASIDREAYVEPRILLPEQFRSPLS
ncbi:MAG: hypothetical protein AB1568_12415 [Thermodesulfobacteriota bacterium]